MVVNTYFCSYLTFHHYDFALVIDFKLKALFICALFVWSVDVLWQVQCLRFLLFLT